MLRFVLEQQGGHRVVEAADGAAAQTILRAESGSADGRRPNLRHARRDLKVRRLVGRDPGLACSRKELQTSIWGVSSREADATTSPVNAYVSELGGRLETDPKNPRYVVTV